MLLYFPNIKIARCDFIPSERSPTYLLHLKSQIKSPAHYPDHPLIEGKIELAGKITEQDFNFWLTHATNEGNYKKIKGKNISSLIEFKPDGYIKFFLLGIGKKDDFAYFFFNKSLVLTPYETQAKLQHNLAKNKTEERKKTKI